MDMRIQRRIQPTFGLQYIKVTPDQKHIVVTDYFVQTVATFDESKFESNGKRYSIFNNFPDYYIVHEKVGL
ncbi:hypothetical protein FQN55_006368 [Onygenales sp. PD_40]|nr:hypothetical protein FQN55_006368 [Onygenales sp. PD_40]